MTMNIDANQNARQSEKTKGNGPAPTQKRDFWDGRAREFSDYAASTEYPEAFIRIMRLRKNWTVLDMACGGGTIAIPLARKVRQITAVDFSRNMLDIVERRCREQGIINVDTIHGRWEDNWASLGIGAHDVAIASRSLMGDDAVVCINKLRKIARKAVYISTVVGSGPVDRPLFEATGREFRVEHDFIYYYNLLYDMGVRANVEFIPETHCNEWATLREAFDGQRWMFRDGLTQEEEQRIKSYLETHLDRVDNRWRLPYPRQCFWAVMWWNNGE
jgi:SAM-dependent methyltransferase